MDDDTEHKKAKGTKKNAVKLMIKNYIDCQFNDKIILKLQQRLKEIVAMYILNKSIRLR